MKKKSRDNSQIVKKDLSEAVDAVLKGVDNMFKEERKFNVENFATKEDLNREVGWLRDDIKGLKADISNTTTKKEFNRLKGKVDKYLSP